MRATKRTSRRHVDVQLVLLADVDSTSMILICVAMERKKESFGPA